ncbi:hypothetical protein LPJGGPFB_04857 [Ensifer adhaerens]|nr:hypothetical protein [Ensifer adhaerens]
MERMEFQISAHRELLIAILCILRRTRPQDWDDLVSGMEDDLVVQDHEEDPGVVPSSAFAVQNALSHELAAILTAVRARSVRSMG